MDIEWISNGYRMDYQSDNNPKSIRYQSEYNNKYMSENDNTTPFDPSTIIDELIVEMGMENDEPEKVKALKQAMQKQMNHVILNTASMNLEPEVIDYVMEQYSDEDEIEFLFAEIIRHSPEAQEAIIIALDEFKEQTLNAFNSFK